MTARTTQALLPVRLPRLGATLARGVRAGRWVFATGLNGWIPRDDRPVFAGLHEAFDAAHREAIREQFMAMAA